MITKTTATTQRLEAFARANYGLTLGIAVSPDNAAGKYFIVSYNNKPMNPWHSLGWSRDDAKEAISQLQETEPT